MMAAEESWVAGEGDAHLLGEDDAPALGDIDLQRVVAYVPTRTGRRAGVLLCLGRTPEGQILWIRLQGKDARAAIAWLRAHGVDLRRQGPATPHQ